MTGTIQNREVFMENIARQFGRSKKKELVERPVWKHRPQDEVMKSATIEELVFVLKDHCKRIHTDFYQTSASDLTSTLRYVIDDFGGGDIIIPKDKRFIEYGLELEKNTAESIHVDVWDYTKGRENIQLAEKANIGITFSEITLAESATVVLFSDRDKGRTICMLPTTHISIIPKSSIVPRMTQAAQLIREKVKNGEVLPSCINFITGPSNSADIEMDLVVGVHGPIRAAYIIVEDK